MHSYEVVQEAHARIS